METNGVCGENNGWDDRIKGLVDAYVDGMRTHPAMLLARQGRLGPAVVHDYLTTIQYLIRFTSTCLERAVVRCQGDDDAQLRALFAVKIPEEVGHEVWASNDIQILRKHFGLAEPGRVLPGAEELAETFKEALESEPVAYLLYAVLTEYMTGCLGLATVEALSERCGIPREALTVLERHADLDAAHAHEGFRVLGQLELDGRRRHAAEQYLHRYLVHLRTVFDSLAEAAQCSPELHASL